MKKIIVNTLATAILFLPIHQCLSEEPQSSSMLGLRTVAYEVNDLNRAVAWYTRVFGVEPYANTTGYVGFSIRGFELGLMPERKDSLKGNNVLAYWGVEDVDAEYARLVRLGAQENTPLINVGGGIRLGTVIDPFGNVLGIIYNPIFKVEL